MPARARSARTVFGSGTTAATRSPASPSPFRSSISARYGWTGTTSARPIFVASARELQERGRPVEPHVAPQQLGELPPAEARVGAEGVADLPQGGGVDRLSVAARGGGERRQQGDELRRRQRPAVADGRHPRLAALADADERVVADPLLRDHPVDQRLGAGDELVGVAGRPHGPHAVDKPVQARLVDVADAPPPALVEQPARRAAGDVQVPSAGVAAGE